MRISDFESCVEKIPECGCWIWMKSLGAGKSGHRYGSLRHDGKTKGAHRLSYEIYVGEIPEGMHVLHRCDVTECVNPHHLFVGTNTQNIFDSMGKNRRKGITRLRPKGLKYKAQKDGANACRMKIPIDQRMNVIGLVLSGVKQKELAKKYGVHQSSISNIVRAYRANIHRS